MFYRKNSVSRYSTYDVREHNLGFDNILSPTSCNPTFKIIHLRSPPGQHSYELGSRLELFELPPQKVIATGDDDRCSFFASRLRPRYVERGGSRKLVKETLELDYECSEK
jgi:hypothetical protein